MRAVQKPVQRAAAYQAAFKKATLHFHPDKFHARFGARLAPSDRAAIEERVREISWLINEERARLLLAP